MSARADRVAKLGESIADYIATANHYESWDKRTVAIEAVRICCEEACEETLLAITEQDAPTMSGEERRAFREDGIVPVDWEWCSDCNGEGQVTVMSGPWADEYVYDCETCAAEQGIVPDASS